MTWYYWIDEQGRGHFFEMQSGIASGFAGTVYVFRNGHWTTRDQ